MGNDALFTCIEAMQQGEAWGTVLDAGTGEHSLRWISGLATERWTAVTGDERMAERLQRRLGDRLRAVDSIVTGNWEDAAFLYGEVFDVVVADYLLGAIDGFAPYFQDQLFHRLRPHVGATLYVVGLAPYPEPTTSWGRMVVELTRFRDACILLAGHRTYREYPLDWTVRHLEAAGFTVEEVRRFPIRYGPSFVEGCLKVSRSKLKHFADRDLASRFEVALASLRERALAQHALNGGVPFGEDYVVQARPCSRE